MHVPHYHYITVKMFSFFLFILSHECVCKLCDKHEIKSQKKFEILPHCKCGRDWILISKSVNLNIVTKMKNNRASLMRQSHTQCTWKIYYYHFHVVFFAKKINAAVDATIDVDKKNNNNVTEWQQNEICRVHVNWIENKCASEKITFSMWNSVVGI